VLSVALGAALLTAGVATARIRPGDRARAEAVATVTSWLRDNVSSGAPVAFDCCLANNVAVNLAGRNPAIQIVAQQDLAFDPRAALGLRSTSRTTAQDWVAVFEAPGNQGTFYGYGEQRLVASLGRSSWWVFVGEAGVAPMVVAEAAFNREHGFQVLAAWSHMSDGVSIRAFILTLEAGRVDFGQRVYFTEEAMARLLRRLEQAGSDGQRIAARLVDRIVVVDPDDRAADLSLRLRRLAAAAPP
jgi:hypothetical protein